MIESEATKNNKTIGQLKDDYVYLLNKANQILQDIPIEIFVDDDKKMDEKLRLLIDGNTNNLSVNVTNCAL